MLTDIAEEVDGTQFTGPVKVIDDAGRILTLELEKALQLSPQTCGPVGDDLLGVEGALALGPRIANEAGGASHQRQRVVPRHLQVAHHLTATRWPWSKARSSRVEAASRR